MQQSDLVERLRSLGAIAEYETQPTFAEAMRKAADEIEHLRALANLTRPVDDTPPASGLVDYSEEALANRQIDFLEERADAWMADTGVQRMFNAIASVFEKYAPQEIMDRFREKLGVIGRQCHVEGALRVWEEIAQQQRALGRPLPTDPAALTTAPTAPVVPGDSPTGEQA